MKEFIFKTPLLLDDHCVVLFFSYGENIQSRGGKVTKKAKTGRYPKRNQDVFWSAHYVSPTERMGILLKALAPAFICYK